MAFVGSLTFVGLARIGAMAVLLTLPGAVARGEATHAPTASQPSQATHAPDANRATDVIEPRRQPMTFTWHPAPKHSCVGDCRDWVEAVGVITSDTPALFEKIANGHDLSSATVVLNSGGGSVLDAIALGRVWRAAGLHTTVGHVVTSEGPNGKTRTIKPNAYCESMCVFLLLAGESRFIPNEAHVRVHQIWMGDRASDAKAAAYAAQDLMIVQRDVGRLAKYTFDMGGTGDLLSLALSVPPWEPLHELTRAELRLSNLVTDEAVAEHAPARATGAQATTALTSAQKPVQERLPKTDAVVKSTKTAEAAPPTGGAALTPGQ